MTKHVYTEEMLRRLVAESLCWREVCEKLDIPPATGSQTHLTKKANLLGIDYSHFKGKTWNTGRSFTKKDVQEYLNIGYTGLKSSGLRKRLIREGLLENKCSRCGLSEWLGEIDICELDHINSNHFDNRLENLQLLCPNCHTVKTREERRARGKITK